MTNNAQPSTSVASKTSATPVIVEPSAEHTHTVIFLHGRGSNAMEFKNELFETEDSSNRLFPDVFPNLKWVFPSAETRFAATEQTEIPQWFDMKSVQRPHEGSDSSNPALFKSIELVIETISKEANLVPMDRVFLGGISQGCATAAVALLCGGVNLGGFIGLSSWLPLQPDVMNIIATKQVRGTRIDMIRKLVDPNGRIQPIAAIGCAALETPVFISHSSDDEVVPPEHGRALFETLRALGMRKIQYVQYHDGGHWINEPKGMDDIIDFIGKATGPQIWSIQPMAYTRKFCPSRGHALA